MPALCFTSSDHEVIRAMTSETAALDEPVKDPLPVLPVKAGDVIRFKPSTARKGEVYHLKAPTISERAAIDRDVSLRCGDPVDARILGLLLRRGVKEVYPAEEIAGVLDRLDARDR